MLILAWYYWVAKGAGLIPHNTPEPCRTAFAGVSSTARPLRTSQCRATTRHVNVPFSAAALGQPSRLPSVAPPLVAQPSHGQRHCQEAGEGPSRRAHAPGGARGGHAAHVGAGGHPPRPDRQACEGHVQPAVRAVAARPVAAPARGPPGDCRRGGRPTRCCSRPQRHRPERSRRGPCQRADGQHQHNRTRARR